MRCETVRRMLDDCESVPSLAREHLERCADCAAYAREWGTLSAGFHLLAQDSLPEPSWRFSERVLRRLNEQRARESSPEFVESAGRRVVLATLALFFALILAMLLPASGPVRHHRANNGTYWSQPETVASDTYPAYLGSAPPVPVIVEMQPADYRENR
ncbi:MAG: anti-sigma factor family protein [Terriglobia bacterium]